MDVKCYPQMYQKSIYEIPYQKLKNKNIKCLVFDLDNTIAFIDQKELTKETKKLFQTLKKDFILAIISNNTTKRVKSYANQLECDFVAYAMKPFTRGFRKIQKKYHLRPEEIGMIGDQIVTDIYGGNRDHVYTILVDPLGTKDLKITSFNRLLEKKILKRYEQKNIMKKGEYYE